MRTSATCCFPLLLAALSFGCASSEPAAAAPQPQPRTVLNDYFDAYLPVDKGRSNEEPWLVLDLHADRRVFIGEQCVFDGAKHTEAQLVERLAELRAAALAEGRCHLVDRETPFGERRVILEPVILCARNGVKYEDIARISDCCSHPSLQVDNVRFGGLSERDG